VSIINNRNRIILFSIVVLSLVLSACSGKEAPISVPAGAQAGDFVDMQTCMYEAGNMKYTADCGTLVVPENRRKLNSRLIALPVIRVHSTGNNPTEPIFSLEFISTGLGLVPLEILFAIRTCIYTSLAVILVLTLGKNLSKDREITNG